MTWRRARLEAVVAAVIASGCGVFAVGAAVRSDGGAPTAAAPTPSSPGVPVDSTATPGETAGSVAAGAVAQISIDKFAFIPAETSVAAGAEITWVNDDDVTHNVFTSDGFLASADLATADTYSVAAGEAGTISYYCDIHQYMRGTITVTP